MGPEIRQSASRLGAAQYDAHLSDLVHNPLVCLRAEEARTVD